MHRGISFLFTILLVFGLIEISEPPTAQKLYSTLYHDDIVSDLQHQYALTSEDNIEVIGAWGKATLRILIVPIEDERFTSWAGRAIDMWKRAIETFTTLYSYEYLSRLELVKLVQGVNGTSGDIVIQYVPSLGERICGVTYVNGYNGEIRRATVQLSLECINDREEYALVVGMHEFGHALGLGHTPNSKDLMYEYLVLGSRPSTLNLYALAVIYSWMDAGYFKRPPDSVSLPSEIQYLQLISSNGEPVRLRVRIYLQLGSSEVLYQTITITAGQSITLNVNPLVNGERIGWERYVFTGWSVKGSGQIISTNSSIIVKPTGHVDYVAIYDVEYRVLIENSLDHSIDSWFRLGVKILINASEISYLSDDVRLVFVEWRGTINTTSRVFEVVVDKPINILAVYRKEFLVEVLTDYGEPEGVGWWPMGTRVNITVDPQYVYLGYDTRLALKGFNGTLTTPQPLISVVLTGPLHLKALWIRQFLVTVNSVEGELFETSWVEEGAAMTISIPPEVVWDNRTKSVFAGWLDPQLGRTLTLVIKVTQPVVMTAVYEKYYLVEVESSIKIDATSSWVKRGDAYEFTVPELVELGDGLRVVFLGSSEGEAGGGKLRVLADGPKTVILYWREEASIVLKLPIEGGERVSWVPVNQVLYLETPSIITLGEDEALEFVRWTGTVESPSMMITLTVNRSLTLTAEYRKLYKIVFTTGPKPLDVILTLKDELGGIYRFPSGEHIWLPAGSLSILSADWLGRDVKNETQVYISGPGAYKVGLLVDEVDVKVLDVFGLPAPFYEVSALRPDGVKESVNISDQGGVAKLDTVSPAAGEVRARWMVFESTAELIAGEAKVRVPISLYTILLASLVSIAVSAVVADRRWRISASASSPSPKQEA
ncbi:MAG: matrixin family metalloprotease [Nitrososphaerota archaeon]